MLYFVWLFKNFWLRLYPNILKKRHILNKALKAINEDPISKQNNNNKIATIFNFLSYQWPHTSIQVF